MKEIYKNILVGLTAITAFTACSDDDIPLLNLKSASIPTSISISIPSDLQQFVYQDENGDNVLPLIKGQSAQLDYTLSPDSVTYKDVEWTTSNSSCVTVDNGNIAAVSGDGAGYSVVSVSPVGVFSGSGIYSSLKVKVDNQLVPATELTIMGTSHEVYAGDTLHLSATILPATSTYRTVKWSSSNEAAATVDANGIVTAQATSALATPVTITATTLDGTNVSATYDLTVKKIVQPQDITLDQTYSADNGYACAINEQSVTLSYTTTPAESTTSLIEWSTSDASIATVDNGVVTFNQNGNFGTVTITATCPETGKSSSVKLNIPAGLLRELYHNENHFSFYNAKQSGNGTSSSHEWHYGYLDITTYKQNATAERADLKWWDTPAYINAGNYPIIAVKMEDVKDLGVGIKSRNINFDCVGTGLTSGKQYKALGNGNNKYTNDWKCSDGSHVFIYDMSKLAFGTGGLAPTNETLKFTTLQLKYADMKTIDHQITYKVYWFQTFKSLDDVKSYLQSEGITYSIVK